MKIERQRLQIGTMFCFEQEEPEAQELCSSLKSMPKGHSIFAHETNVDITNRFVVFNLKRLSGKPAVCDDGYSGLYLESLLLPKENSLLNLF